jgi:hypothetical protein
MAALFAEVLKAKGPSRSYSQFVPINLNHG